MSIKARVVQPQNIRVKQATINASNVNLGAKEVNELSDIDAEKIDDGLMSYDEELGKWVTTTTLDGGTF